MKQQHKRTILVLDDDEINLMIMIKNIQEAGYQAQSLTSGEEAFAYLTHHPHEIDIALLDKMLPDVGGIELLKRIKSTDKLLATSPLSCRPAMSVSNRCAKG